LLASWLLVRAFEAKHQLACLPKFVGMLLWASVHNRLGFPWLKPFYKAIHLHQALSVQQCLFGLSALQMCIISRLGNGLLLNWTGCEIANPQAPLIVVDAAIATGRCGLLLYNVFAEPHFYVCRSGSIKDQASLEFFALLQAIKLCVLFGKTANVLV